MARVSVGQIENLEDLIRGLESIRETLETSCREQIAAAERQCDEAREETQNSEGMLEQAQQKEREAQQALSEAQQDLERAENELNALVMACVVAAVAIAAAQAAVVAAAAVVAMALAALTQAVANRQRMEQRFERAKQALSMAERELERIQQECSSRMCEVNNFIDLGRGRLVTAHRALDDYIATNQPVAKFREWLQWNPEQDKLITPEIIRDRMNLSSEQQHLLQEYLFDRNPSYRNMIDKYRSEWAAANGDVERNIINRSARTNLSGEFTEQLARHAISPLGGKVQTQNRTYVGDSGRYTKTDLIISDLRVPVVLGHGDHMGAPAGGSMAFEVKCGKADYLYNQKDHMLFQAEGHRQADLHCTLCSRDIHSLPPEKEKDLRNALQTAGSPLLGMLPMKNDIDKSCLAFIRPEEDGDPQ